MEKVNTESKDITPSAVAKKFNPVKHYNEVFGMFTGKTEEVTIEIDAKLLDAMIDRFGENLEFTTKENDKLVFTVQVQVSPQFIGWCCSFGDLLKVIAPSDISERIKAYLLKAVGMYNQIK